MKDTESSYNPEIPRAACKCFMSYLPIACQACLRNATWDGGRKNEAISSTSRFQFPSLASRLSRGLVSMSGGAYLPSYMQSLLGPTRVNHSLRIVSGQSWQCPIVHTKRSKSCRLVEHSKCLYRQCLTEIMKGPVMGSVELRSDRTLGVPGRAWRPVPRPTA